MDPHHQELERRWNQAYTRLQSWAALLRLSVAELVFFSLFIVNYVFGKIINACGPAEQVFNYWNNKRNFVNQVFVKRGWGWTTLVLVVFYGIQWSKRRITPRQLGSATIRYAIVTTWWWLFTQWCFGLPIMDKVFVLTGGQCVVHEPNSRFDSLSQYFLIDEELGRWALSRVTSYTCRRLKGSWEGGHDPLGHVFLLVQLSLFLFLESEATWYGWTHFYVATKNFIHRVKTSSDKLEVTINYLVQNPHVLVIWLCSLWWLMLFMTNIYFHLVFEKFVGLLFGFMAILAIYVAPRWSENRVLRCIYEVPAAKEPVEQHNVTTPAIPEAVASTTTATAQWATPPKTTTVSELSSDSLEFEMVDVVN